MQERNAKPRLMAKTGISAGFYGALLIIYIYREREIF